MDSDWIYFKPAEGIKSEFVVERIEPAIESEKTVVPTPTVAPEVTPKAPEVGKGFEAKPVLPEVPPEFFEEGIKQAPPAAALETSTPVASRRKMKRNDRGEVLVRPKGGGRARWMTKDKYEKEKELFDVLDKGVEERVARLMEIIIKEG
jgi:hypothetical protein